MVMWWSRVGVILGMAARSLVSGGVYAFRRALEKAAQNGEIASSVQKLESGYPQFMTVSEAKRILGIIGDRYTQQDVLQNSTKLFDMNIPEKGGSSYLQGKIVAARKLLEEELQKVKLNKLAAKKRQ